MKTLHIGDIHYGHKRNYTRDIINNFKIYFRTYKDVINQLDYIFLNGDVFDRLLNTNSDEYKEITNWFGWLVSLCVIKKIKLRVLEGTPSHDWRQMKAIANFVISSDLNVDFKYIDCLYVERDNDLDKTILYIPDEYNDKASETYDEVKELLKKENLLKVDVTIMHGHFHYQLPKTLESSHNELDYLFITDGFIVINHVHTHSVFKKILAPGSFDRLSHGEEEAKGGMYVEIGKENTYRFLPNKNAKTFIDYVFEENSDLSTNIKKLKKFCRKLKPDSYVRLINTNNDLNIKEIEKYVSDINFKIKDNRQSDKEIINLISHNEKLNLTELNNKTIPKLMKERLIKRGLTKEEVNIIMDEIMKKI